MDKDKYLLIISLPFLKSVKSGVILRILQENQELYSVFSCKIGSCGKDINNVLEMEKKYNNSEKIILPPLLRRLVQLSLKLEVILIVRK